MKVLFARIGYMTYYKGCQSGDEKPIGGGDYNKLNTGHEIYNFKDVDGKIYGYFQPYLKKGEIHLAKINIGRVEPGCNESKLDNVLVIFFSSLPSGEGQAIVGWYKNATVYRNYQKSGKQHHRDRYAFNIEAETKNAVLLPSYRRLHILAGKGLPKKGRPGRTNAFYVFDNNNRKTDKWITSAIKYVSGYDSENILSDPSIEGDSESAFNAEKVFAKSTGQSFNPSVIARIAIENYSMKKAKEYFSEKLKYKFVKDSSRTHSYDLEFVKNGEPLFVEVKGTQTNGKSVFLTYNERLHVDRNKKNCALFVLHSIEVKENKNSCTCKGGEIFVKLPWVIDDDELKIVTYQYDVRRKELI